MKPLLTDKDKKHFSDNHYKFNMTQLMVGLIILTVVMQPLFLDRDNPNGALMLAAFLVTMLAFSGIGFFLIVLVRKSLINGHLEEVIQIGEVEPLNDDLDYYVPSEYINDDFIAIKGLFLFGQENYFFISKDKDFIVEGKFPVSQAIEYKDIHVKGISNIIKEVPKRLYIPNGDLVHVFVIPEGHKILEIIGENMEEK